MRLVYILLFALILLFYTSCKPEEVDESDSIDLYFKCQVDTSLISNYLEDLTLVLKREGDYSLQPFLAYRRLEALSNQVFDIDHLGYVFYNDLHNPDTLNKKVNEWIDWLESNKCKIDRRMADSVFAVANAKMDQPNYSDPNYKSKLRQLQGLSPSDESQDSFLIEKNRQKYKDNFLEW